MKTKSCFVLMVVLSLLLLLVPACGGDDKGTPTSTSTSTVILTTTPTATPTQVPVKIGEINAYSGPGAMSGTAFGGSIVKLVEWQVKQQGGILGGREVKIVKFDDGTSLAQGVAGVTKLVLDENVSGIYLGGVSGAEQLAVSDECERMQVLFVPIASMRPGGVVNKKFTVEVMPGRQSIINGFSNLAIDTFKVKSVAFLITGGYEDKASMRDEMRKNMEAAGISIVYSETTPVGTMDFSPFLTKIKKANPELLILNEDSEYSMSIAKQIMDLGGWGNIKVAGVSQSSSAAKLAGAEGWIIQTVWDPDSANAASKKFKEEFKTINGSAPVVNHMWYYITAWTVINAVELAGTTDRLAVATAARSGNLQFDTPLGRAHVTTDGAGGLEYVWVQIQKGGGQVAFNP